MKEIVKNNITIILLTVVVLTEIICLGSFDTTFLYLCYGFYKLSVW